MAALYEHSDSTPLIRLLGSHLPHSLPTFSPLLTPGNPLKVYTTFKSTAEPAISDPSSTEQPWIVLIDSGNQFRFYCNLTTREPSPEKLQEAEDLIESVIREVMDRASREGREVVRIGAVPDRWTGAVSRVTGVECISASRVWCDPSYYRSEATQAPLLIPDHDKDSTTQRIEAPEGFEFREATEADIPIILSTSEVPHLPSYLLTRLSHTSCLFSTSPPTSTSPSPAASSTSELAAHVTTHRDGSLGTLYVNPSYRRLGLARLVLQHRLSKMREPGREGSDEEDRKRLGFCYVHRENEASRAVMKSLGWRESEGNVAWDIVDVKAWDAKRKVKK